MIVLTKDIKTLDDVRMFAEDEKIHFDANFVAVEALVFDDTLKWVLMRRGPACRDEQLKLEGIGGRVENENDLTLALKRELLEEAGDKAVIEILEAFEIRTDTVFDSRLHKEITWIIVSFLCSYKNGELIVCEPTKNMGFERYFLKNINILDLSSSAKSAYKSLIQKWDIIQEILAEGDKDND